MDNFVFLVRQHGSYRNPVEEWGVMFNGIWIKTYGLTSKTQAREFLKTCEKNSRENARRPHAPLRDFKQLAYVTATPYARVDRQRARETVARPN